MTDQQYWTLLITLLSAVLGAIVAIMTIVSNNRRKRKDQDKIEYDTYKQYSKPIMFAAESLAWRLREVLQFKGVFLMPDAPMNGFFKYKFDSTIYRISALIGWIRAAQKENSYIEGYNNNSKNSGIRESITNFQKILADGNHAEISIYEELCKLYGYEIIPIGNEAKLEIAIEIEKIIFKYIPDQVKKNVHNIEETSRLEMVKSIMEFIAKKTNQEVLLNEQIKEKFDIALEEIAREFCWIYRDWQNAIGDEMIIQLKVSKRLYDVIGFGAFMDKHPDNMWLMKVDNLFSNLDVSIDNRFDSRVRQVKLIYIAVVNLIEELNSMIKGEEAISENGLAELEKYKKVLIKDTEGNNR